MKDNTKYFFVILASVITVFSIPLLIMDIQVTKAYDVYPSTDTARESARTTQSEVYRFGNPVDNPVQYSDGTIVPSRTFSIEAMNHTTGKYEIIGYINVHGHKVKIDSTDVYDISIGSTIRFNPKVS